jgi:hypothetical protein
MVVLVKISDSDTDASSGPLVHTLDLCGSGAETRRVQRRNGGWHDSGPSPEAQEIPLQDRMDPRGWPWRAANRHSIAKGGPELLGFDLAAENISKACVPERGYVGDHANASVARSRSPSTQKTLKTIKTKKHTFALAW